MKSLETKIFFLLFRCQHPRQQHHNARPRIVLCLNNPSKTLQHLSLEELRLTIASEHSLQSASPSHERHALHASLHHRPAATMWAFLFGAACVLAFAWTAFPQGSAHQTTRVRLNWRKKIACAFGEESWLRSLRTMRICAAQCHTRAV